MLRKKRGEVHKFINEELRKKYIRPLKLPQIAPVLFVGKKNGKERMIQDYKHKTLVLLNIRVIFCSTT